MNAPVFPFPSHRLQKLLLEASQRSSELHDQFLQHRQTSLHGLQKLIEVQLRGDQPAHPAQLAQAAPPPLFTSEQLDQFGTGKLSNCFGPSFAAYDQRRIPRIPNGDLKMMDRIIAISGKPCDFAHPAEVIVEYDVPQNAWYLRETVYPEMPFSLLMETALQPCGFLSAFLDFMP